MLDAQHPAATVEDVLLQVTGGLHLPQRVQVLGEAAGRDQGVRVVGPQHPAEAVQGVLLQVTGGLHLPQHVQVGGEVTGREQRLGVIGAQYTAAGSTVSWSRSRAASTFPSPRRALARLWAERRASEWSTPSTRRKRSSASSSRPRAACTSSSPSKSPARELAERRASG